MRGIMREPTCVVLAAGLGTRMGGDKLTKPFGEGTILDAVLAACVSFPTMVVVSPGLKLGVLAPNMHVLVNHEPERGMAHSLRLANAAVSADDPIAVLLGDKPLVNADLVKRMIDELGDNDVAYPVRNGTPGHPVVFSPFARALIIALRDGDTIHMVRDHEMLVRRAVQIDEAGAYTDIDTEEDYRRWQP
ncbi:MAG: nucleotidyltransferase family protein [Vulcanimicrobiaceae bacterium]